MTMTSPALLLRSLDATWNYARWEQLPDDGKRYEVIDGVLYMTTPASSYHQWITIQLFDRVGEPLRYPGRAYPFIAPITVLMPGCDPVQPDFLLVVHEHASILRDGRIHGAPDLIAEIVSVTDPEFDTDIKRRAYARAGVPEYWLIRPATRDVLVYWQPNPLLSDYDSVEHFAEDEQLVSSTLPAFVAVADLFAGAPDTTL